MLTCRIKLRLIYFSYHRLGGENLAVAQNTYSVTWFKGKELNLVFGLQLSISRVVRFLCFLVLTNS